MQNEEKKSKKKIILILSIIAAVIIIAGVVFWLYQNSQVAIGDKKFNNKIEELTLKQGEYDAETLSEVLPKFTLLKKLSLPETDLTSDEMAAIRKISKTLEIDYTVEINGQTCDESTKNLDLSGMKSDETEKLLTKLGLLPALTDIKIVSPAESDTLTIADFKQIREAVPDVKIFYEFDLFGQRVSTETERLEYDTVEIGNKGAEEIREALSIMPDCNYVLLDECGIDNEIMASIRDEYPEKKIVWRVYLDGGYPFDFLTDEEILRLSYGLDDENTKVLQYCTNVVYMDLGHNPALTDISFVRNMPRLECCILSISSVQDLSPLKDCPNLTWLELIDCASLTDISPLKDCPSIRYLNIGRTSVSDISATDALPKLERFVAAKLNIPAAVQEAFKKQHPDCIAVFGYNANPFGYGWRDNYYGDFFEYYKHMREVFHYDGNEIFGNQKIAIICPLYLKDVPGYPWYEWQTTAD